MRIVNVDEFLAEMVSPTCDVEYLSQCMDKLDRDAAVLVTCDECKYSFQFHRSLFCKRFRRASEPLTDMMVEQTGYCSEGRMK